MRTFHYDFLTARGFMFLPGSQGIPLRDLARLCEARQEREYARATICFGEKNVAHVLQNQVVLGAVLATAALEAAA